MTKDNQTQPSETLFGDRPPQSVGQGAKRTGGKGGSGVCFLGRVFSCFSGFRVVPGSTTDTGSRPHATGLDRLGCLKGTCPRETHPPPPKSLKHRRFPRQMAEVAQHSLQKQSRRKVILCPRGGSPTTILLFPHTLACF